MVDQPRSPPGSLLDDASIHALQAQVRGPVLCPGDGGYEAARTVWNAMIDKRPALIGRCTGAADVRAAVRFAREQPRLVAVRGGGRHFAG